jgi:hypothetical protein
MFNYLPAFASFFVNRDIAWYFFLSCVAQFVVQRFAIFIKV